MKISKQFSFNYRLNSKITTVVKYTVYLAFSVLVLITVAHYIQKTFSYCVKKFHETPAKLKNHIAVSPLLYTSDSLYLSHIISQLNDEKNLKTDKRGSTLIIDTIIYDSTFNKLSFWVLLQTTNSDFKVSSYIYTGNGYYAFRNNITAKLKVSAFIEKADSCPSYDKIRELLETRFFYNLASAKSKKGQKPTYNWDDIRLWKGAVSDSIANKSSYSINNKGKVLINPSLNSEIAKLKADSLKKTHSPKLKLKKKKSRHSITYKSLTKI